MSLCFSKSKRYRRYSKRNSVFRNEKEYCVSNIRFNGFDCSLNYHFNLNVILKFSS